MTPHQFFDIKFISKNNLKKYLTKLQTIGIDKYFTHFPTWMGCFWVI